MKIVFEWAVYIFMLPFLLTGWIVSWGIIGWILDFLLIVGSFSMAAEIDNSFKFLPIWFSVSSIICLILDLLTDGIIWWFVTDITWFLLGRIAIILIGVALVGIIVFFIRAAYNFWNNKNISTYSSVSSGYNYSSTSTSTSTSRSPSTSPSTYHHPQPRVPIEKKNPTPVKHPQPKEDDWTEIVKGANKYGKRLRVNDYKDPMILKNEITSTAAFKSCFYKLLYWKRDLDQLQTYGQAALHLVDFALNSSSNIDREEVRVFLTKTMKRRVENHRGWDGDNDPEKSVYWPHRADYLDRAISKL